MSVRPKVPLYVSLKNVHALEASDALLENIETELESLERRLTLVECRVTVEGQECGPCQVQVDVTLSEARQASSWSSGSDLGRVLRMAFGACGKLVAAS